MDGKRQLVTFLEGLHADLHTGVSRRSSRCGLMRAPAFLCVLEGSISVVYSVWHEPFLFNLVDLVGLCEVENILWAAFTNWLALTPPQTENCGAFIHFERSRVAESISSTRTNTLPKGEKISLCFNEIRDVVDVNQTETSSCSCLVSRNKSLWLMHYSTWE